MKKTTTNPYLTFFRNCTFLLVGIAFFIACDDTKKKTPNEELEEAKIIPITTEALSISPDLPGVLTLTADENDLATFAWNEFFALNWESSWDSLTERAKPNKDWSFKSGGEAPNLAVWETYFHRTELRPSTSPLTDIDGSKPSYDYSTAINFTDNGINPSDFWNNLDEDNEIGSAFLFAYDSIEVLYMAKANLGEYNYLKTNLPDNTVLSKAKSNGKDTTYLKNRTLNNLACNSDTATNVVCLPCGDLDQNGEVAEGAIEIKTAWRFLVPGKDDFSRFIIKKVLFYTKDASGKLIANQSEMALIGMHIIRKMKNYPTFVFASFEQVDVRNNYNYTPGNTEVIESIPIMNYYGSQYNSDDPHKSAPVVPRDISPTIMAVNEIAKDSIIKDNNESLWQYYRLIGVQGKPIDYVDRASDPNYFMANYVIESDSALTLFHGSFAEPFNGEKNVVTNGMTVNMGGCQGCHGQAQASGQDFSFILDGGAGSPISEPDVLQSVEMVRKTVGDTKKLKAFIARFK